MKIVRIATFLVYYTMMQFNPVNIKIKNYHVYK